MGLSKNFLLFCLTFFEKFRHPFFINFFIFYLIKIFKYLKVVKFILSIYIGMSFFNKFFWHLHTVNTHRRRVRRLCFKLWLYRQWLTHDLSKYTFAEFSVWIKYFQWFRSPNAFEREDVWYSSAWLHHKWRNKHHYEYRNDLIDWWYNPVKMPIRYVKEMFCDMIAAGKTYKWNNFKNWDPFDYFYANTDFKRIHKNTVKLLDSRLKMFKEKWDEKTFLYIRQNYKNNIWQNY